MGTNYYVELKPAKTCECCNHTQEAEVYHLGKSSCGWVFLLHTDPEQGLNTLEDVLDMLEKSGGNIRSEYGEYFTLESFRGDLHTRKGKLTQEDVDRYNKEYGGYGSVVFLHSGLLCAYPVAAHGETGYHPVYAVSYNTGEFS